MPRTESPGQGRLPGKKKLSRTASSPPDLRRMMALVLSISMLTLSVLAWLFMTTSSGTFVAAACGRIGLVLGALWLAWPSLKRPAKWLPASVPVIGVIALIVVAAQPRLIIPAIPIVGGLIALSAFVKVFRRP